MGWSISDAPPQPPVQARTALAHLSGQARLTEGAPGTVLGGGGEGSGEVRRKRRVGGGAGLKKGRLQVWNASGFISIWLSWTPNGK